MKIRSLRSLKAASHKGCIRMEFSAVLAITRVMCSPRQAWWGPARRIQVKAQTKPVLGLFCIQSTLYAKEAPSLTAA